MFHLVERLDLKHEKVREFFMPRWPNKSVSYCTVAPEEGTGAGRQRTILKLTMNVVVCIKLRAAINKATGQIDAASSELATTKQNLAEQAEKRAPKRAVREDVGESIPPKKKRREMLPPQPRNPGAPKSAVVDEATRSDGRATRKSQVESENADYGKRFSATRSKRRRRAATCNLPGGCGYPKNCWHTGLCKNQ
eukprot:SAG11_NODE_4626_length_1830_cov_1.229925_2_plen_194_part_00